jgi:hypothetical protein
MKAAEAAYASLKVPGNPTENGDVAARRVLTKQAIAIFSQWPA